MQNTWEMKGLSQVCWHQVLGAGLHGQDHGKGGTSTGRQYLAGSVVPEA